MTQSLAITAPRPGSFAEFWADLRRAATISRQLPFIPVLDLALSLLLAGSNHLSASLSDDPLIGLLALGGTAIYASAVGWFGAQRVAFRAAMIGQPFGLAQVPAEISSQGWRFIKLAFLLLPAGAVFLAIVVLSTDDLLSTTPQMSLAGQVLAAALGLALAMALTLVTPSLALENVGAREAWNRGTRRLRTHWRLIRWHVAVLPLAVAVGPLVFGVESGLGQTLSLAVTSLTFLVRGAVVAAHLRLREKELAELPPPRVPIL